MMILSSPILEPARMIGGEGKRLEVKNLNYNFIF